MEANANPLGNDAAAQQERQARVALRVRLSNGEYAMPIKNVERIVGFAELSGQGDDIFLGWLTYHGARIPVFDLNQAICEQATERTFGSRIAIVQAGKGEAAMRMGLLVQGPTDTVAHGAENMEPLPLEMYCSMLVPLVPSDGEDAA